MTPELWQRLKPLFHAALKRNTEDRATFIADACGDDAELKDNLTRLVCAAEQNTGTIDRPVVHRLPTEPARFRPGEVISERFRIVRPIGSGGMGEVYEAEDLQLGRVALKTIRYDATYSSETFDRFRQEVQLARKVTGPQVCRIHEFYQLPARENRPITAFLTMEYLEGITLSEKIRNDGPLPPKLALRIAVDLCDGLSLVHAKGIIHRDLKSANIMLCGQDDNLRAVLMDFGLARDFRVTDTSTPEMAHVPRHVGTLAGDIMGTPAYMAPEQFEGKPTSPVTDIYALGIVLYELVTGLHPYAAPAPLAAAIRRAQHTAPPSSLNHAISRKWDRVIHQCLQYEPAERFQSAGEVAAVLRAGPANISHLREDRPWLFRIACTLIAAVTAWGIFSWWQMRQYYHADPESLNLYNNGLSLIREGNYAEATRVLEATLKKDSHFAMAHARLAEAMYDLDFQGNAQHELLTALPGRNRLTPLDRKYLDAIQSTVTGDASGALGEYQQILDELPPTDRSSGYVDLGMAYERAGDIGHSLDSYSKATALNSINPAAYIHVGILQSRLHHVKEDDQAFDHAQQIFESEIDSYGRQGNPEGLAELDYERGYAANDRGDSKLAVPLLEHSLEEAEKIPSIQLEIRSLIQLSSAESNSSQDAQAVDHVNRAIQLARDNRLESWVATGLVRLANVQLVQGNSKEAEEPLQEAQRMLHENPQPRVEAFANATLASLMNQEHQTDKVAQPAQAALDYYKKHGFSEGTSNAGALLVRAERDDGNYKQALKDADALLLLDQQHGLPVFIMQAEELVGTIYLALEQYPEALEHFQNAEKLADSDMWRSYQALHCADALWRLGRFSESETMFRLASGNTLLLPSISQQRVESFLRQQKFGASLRLAQQVIAQYPDMTADSKDQLKQDIAVAEAHLGMKNRALAVLPPIVTPNQSNVGPADSAQNQLTAAEIYLWLGMYQQARDAALMGLKYFSSGNQLDSELQCAGLATAASKAMKDEAGYLSSSKKTVDILIELRHTWNPASLETYLARPDIRALTAFLPQNSQ